ncbi:cell filamentation protein Fic [bacterium]|nr:cell filamentation protein Fic [bacterium]|tara:strand:- start:468 stop:1553 length:1086 start_codon:yes stop_codon:yes gene_type:complete
MKPYLPLKLPIQKMDWVKFIQLIGRANAEVARFDGLLQSMPNPAVLLSPLTTQEAVLSSKIEGTKATLQDVLKYEANPKEKTEKYHDIQEILNYRKAMVYALKELKNISFTNRLIRGIHSILLDGVRGQGRDRGNFRKMQVHIGKSVDIKKATYIPPIPQDVPKLMSNLEKYIHADDKDFLVQLAIVHAQFEIIHPFWDGNGRVGRIIMPIFLYFKKVLSSPMFYLSAYFETNREAYYQKLLLISQDNDWEGWVIYFLNAVIIQSKENINKAKSIHKLYDIKKDKIAETTRSRYAIKTLDFLFCNPIFTSSQFVSMSRIPKTSAWRLLRLLEQFSIIKIIHKGAGTKPSTYVFTKLLKIVG